LWNSTNPWQDLKEAVYGKNYPVNDTDKWDDFSDYENFAKTNPNEVSNFTSTASDWWEGYDTSTDTLSNATDTFSDMWEGYDFSSQLANESGNALTQGSDALTNTSAFTMDTGGVDALTPGATGSVPYLGYATGAYNALTRGASALASPGTVGTVAATTGALSGVAAGAMAVGGAIYGGVGLGIYLMSKYYHAGDPTGINPFYTYKGGARGIQEHGDQNWPGYMKYINPWDLPMEGYDISKYPSTTELAARFKAQTGYDAPTGNNINKSQYNYYANWVTKQPEIYNASKDFLDWFNATYVGFGDESGNQTYVKKDEYLKTTFGY
jgi:hypothetical protein